MKKVWERRSHAFPPHYNSDVMLNPLDIRNENSHNETNEKGSGKVIRPHHTPYSHSRFYLNKVCIVNKLFICDYRF